MKVSPRADRERLRYRFRTLLKATDDGALVWKRDPGRIANYADVLHGVDALSQRVGAIAAPFLLVRGERSRVTSEKMAAALAANFQEGKLTSVADAAHK